MLRIFNFDWSSDVYTDTDQTVPLAIFNGWTAKENAELFVRAKQGRLGELHSLIEEVETLREENVFLKEENERLRETVGVPTHAILDWDEMGDER